MRLRLVGPLVVILLDDYDNEENGRDRDTRGQD